MHRHRNPQIGSVTEKLRAGESLRRDTHQCELVSVQFDDAADDGWIGAKTAFPVAVSKDGDGVASRRPIVFRNERAAHDGLRSEPDEVVPGYDLSPDHLRLVTVGKAQWHAEVREDIGEDIVLLAIVQVIWEGKLAGNVQSRSGGIDRD